MIDELSALRRIEEHFNTEGEGIEIGVGDDAAAVRISPGMLLVATTDCQVEDVHFIKSLITPEVLTRKSVAVSVSDIAAMGGVPKYILASAGFSKDEDEEFLSRLIKGFRESEIEFGVELIGGNLSSSEKVFLDITALGEVEPEKAVKREGASPGDLIYVSGTLGDSALGLRVLKNGTQPGAGEKLIERHLTPRPRLALGRGLALGGYVTSMIDVSDGLMLDLGRITVDKGLGARIYVDAIPTSAEYKEVAGDYSQDIHELSLSGGEDYELLFTSREEHKDKVFEIAKDTETWVTEIGVVTGTKKIEILDSDGTEINLKRRGFVHFN